jgi:hypothetical protein
VQMNSDPIVWQHVLLWCVWTGLSGSCEKVAKIFSLTVECFQQLNPHIDCSEKGKGLHGQTFCQGSGCPLHKNGTW